MQRTVAWQDLVDLREAEHDGDGFRECSDDEIGQAAVLHADEAG